MSENKTSSNFSQAYYNCKHPLFFEYHSDKKKEDFLVGPFAELENILYKYSNLKALKEYDQGIAFFRSVEQKLKESLERFNFEGCSMEDRKSEYVNEQLSYLINRYKGIQNTKFNAIRKSTFFVRSEVLIYIDILLNTYKKLLWEVQTIFHQELNQENLNFFNQHILLKEPVRSFYLKHKVEKQHFYLLYLRYFHRKFTSSSTNFDRFSVLFEDKVVIHKVNWIGTKASLVYFIKQLIKKELIRNPKNKHWKMVSASMLYKNEVILTKELLNQPPPKKADQILINQFLDGLKPQN